MKVLSTEGLTKLVSLIKETFVDKEDAVVTQELSTVAVQSLPLSDETFGRDSNNKLAVVGSLNQNNSLTALGSMKLWQGSLQEWTNGEPTPWYYWQTSATAMWTSGGSLPSSGIWNSVTYGNGTFVAVSDNSNKAVYSTDGINWTASTLPSSAFWCSVTYGDGKFVAVALDSDKAAYSTDGINWIASTLPSFDNWWSVTYGDGKFVAVIDGNSDQAAYSTDGINWIASTMPMFGSWYSVTYGDGKFVAVAGGNSDQAAYSTDGINWITSTLPDFAYWASVTYGDGKFVAVANDDKAAYSTDGINWIASTMPMFGSWWSVAYGDGKFVATIYESSNEAAYSADGINWKASTLPSSESWRSTAYGNDKFVAVAADSDSTAIFTMSYDRCYTLDQIPTTSTQVYSDPETLSAKTITSTGEGAITLSDNLTYNYTPSGNQNTYRTMGDAHPNYVCLIDDNSIRIGNTMYTPSIDSMNALNTRVTALEEAMGVVSTRLDNINGE